MVTRLTQDEVKSLYQSFTHLSPFMADEMYETMSATGRSQFSLEEIYNFADQALDRAADQAYKTYQDSLKEEVQHNATAEAGTLPDYFCNPETIQLPTPPEELER